MARRKVITSNTGKNRAVSVALHSVQDDVQHNSKKINNRLHTENTQIPVSSQEKAHFEFRFNNNDHKYLHKKFKKMAFAVTQQVDDIAQPISQSTSINFIKVPSPKRADPQSEIAISINNHIKYSNILIDRELENNVQIKFKNANDNTSDNYGLNSVSDCNEAITRDNKISEKTDSTEIDTHSNKETMNGMSNGRYVCPYCKLSCAKPSVLQKHIRAHTNERPYPCTPCGFAFKTKSNLYKHCRSRAHALRLQGTDSVPSANEDEWSLGSESDVSLSATSLSENSLRVDNLSGNENSSPDIVYQNERVSPTTTHSSGTSQTEFKPKSIYKPKFHKASMYRDNGIVKQELSPSAVFLNQHIAKIISDNEAVVDTLDSPLQKKFSKKGTIQRQIGEIPNKTILVETKELQPLNLTKENAESETNMRKRCFSDSFAHQEAPKASQHPLNPEGSIIKDLLLKARAQATGLLPVTSEDYDGTETLYMCPLCQISYRSADNLEIHRLYYCKGNSVNNRIANLRPENIYLRSNSIHVTLPETYNPNTLAKLATSTLKSPSARVAKPDDLIIKHDSNDIISTPLPSPGPLLGNTRLVDSKYSSENRFQVYENDHNQVTNIAQDVLFHESKVSADLPHRSDVYTPPSKKKCLENDDLPHGNLFTPPSKKRALESDDLQHRSDLCTPPSKKRGLENNPTTLRSLEELSLSPMRQSSSSLQMFGGEVKIVDNSGTTTTLRIEPTRSQLSPSHVPQSLASPRHQSQSETSSIVVRSGIHSGGTLVHNPPTPKEIMPSPLPQTPRLKVSIAPNISTPNLSVAGIPPPNMSHFQFPPIGSITAYNPLTLPPLSPIPSPNGPSTILHGGKMIPYVPGMPGPNTPTTYLPTHHSVGLKFPTLERITDSPGKEDKQTFSSVGLAQLAERTLKTQNDKKESNIRLQHLRANLNSPDINTKQNNTAKWVNNNCDNTKINSSQSISSTGLRNHNMSNIVIHSNDIVQINFGIMTSVTENIKREDLLKNSTEILQPDISRREVKIVTTYASSESVNINSQDPQKEMHHLNFENLISKSEIINNSTADHHEMDQSITFIDLTSTPSNQERSKTSYFKKNIASTAVGVADQKTKFLRPSSLPLKPGTFIPKKHHGITPNANTTSLISPETPRPAKAFGQLYLNGHAYTYLGLKCSTKVYYCTLNRPQPTYVPNQHSLSMYSNWQVCLEATPHPLGLNPCKAMSIYDSRHRPQNVSTARLKQEQIITHSSKWRTNQEIKKVYSQDESDERKTDSCGNKNKELAGGFESNEEYIYVRGRGRGRYVCSECGIRCKKPSMLKKHIRTHTDVRPYTCKHCAFSFKTKGNLTKHMKSKSHYQKCRDLGINPFEEIEASEASQGSLETDEGSDSDEDDGNEGETESSDTDSWKSRLPEHEAAQSLLSLWDGGNTTTITPGLLTSARPTTYPYAPQQADEIAITDASVVPTDFPTKPYKEEMSRMERDEPMDLSKVEPKLPMVTEIVMATQEHTVIASLAQNASRFPQNQNQWPGGEPMLHAYLTEKALRDSKIKQSQYTYNKLRSIEDQIDSINIKMEKADLVSSGSHERAHSNAVSNQAEWLNSTGTQNNIQDINVIESTADQTSDKCNMLTLANAAVLSLQSSTPQVYTWTQVSTGYTDSRSNENAKFVASEYLKITSGKTNEPQDRQFHPHADSIVEHTEENGGNIRSMRENLDKNEDDKQIFSDHLGTARKVVVGAWGMSFKVGSASNEFPSASNFATGRLTEDGRSVCVACNKSFSKPSQLRLHINIHYMERPFRCSACAVSFRTRGHLQKHERSGSHHNKVSMTSTFGAATTANPRPFKCSDCKIAFRIHGHLAKHLRSKMHVMRLECLGKLPFGTFAEIERAGVSLTDIDTTDCDNSLASLQILAQKLHEKDPTKLESWDPVTMVPPLLPAGRESSDEEDISGPDNKSDSNETRSAYKRTESTDFVKAQYSATNT